MCLTIWRWLHVNDGVVVRVVVTPLVGVASMVH
jgi:hypothetical protein